jgi:hypothetical protein
VIPLPLRAASIGGARPPGWWVLLLMAASTGGARPPTRSLGWRVLLLLMAAGAGVAHAQTPDSVVMVRVSGDEELAARLRGELRRADWKVIELTPRREQQGRALEELATGWSAEAAIRVRPRSFDVELWVAGRGADEPGTLELVNAGKGNDPGLLAVRVTEAMRARGLVIEARMRNPNAGGPGAGSTSNASAGSGVATVPPPTSEAIGRVANAPPNPSSTHGNAARTAEAPGATRGSGAAGTEAPSAPATPRPAPSESAGPASKPPQTTLGPQPKAPLAPHRNEATPPRNEGPPAPGQTTAERTDATATGAAAPEASSSPAADGGASRSVFALELAPALLWSLGQPGHLSAGGDAFFNLRLRPFAHVAFSAFALGPILPFRFEHSDGNVTMRSLIMGVGVDLLLDLGSWELQGGLAGASVLSWFIATPNDDTLVRHDVSQRTAALLLRAAALFRLAPSSRLSLRAFIGLGVPELKLTFSTEPVASWGRPLLGGSIGLELAVF